ncbi:TBC1 domain family member 15 [Musca vetustissima]|uniref:TBC1 domain family member 15 n=1 Tax=Musca vetustissima TaxID=27455 RepID=UPI002AB75F4C|nr:TBC1 domain family member 15 [Musca vetustissima]
MINSVRFEREESCEHMQFNVLNESLGAESPSQISGVTMSGTSSTTNTDDSLAGTGNILCTHDGVLLKKASAEHIADLNNSGSLSLVEYGPPRRLYIEWKPNENILIADDSQDQEDWALVDTISRRSRTISECKAFNTKPMETSTGSLKSRCIRTCLEDLSGVEVKHRGQTIRFLRKCDGTLHSEFFFQHGNADLFVRSMRQLHIIDIQPSTRSGEEYVILTTETQKLKKTFAELDIGEIKSSSVGNESWLPHKVVGFLVNIPDYVSQKAPPRVRPGSLDAKERQISSPPSDKYHMVGLADSSNTSGSHSRGSSLDKSPDMDSSGLENVKEIDEKIVTSLPERRTIERGRPLNENQWLEFMTPEGRVSDSKRVLEIIFHGGIEPNLRPEVWKYLLNYYQWNDSEVEKIARRKEKSMEYYNMKAQWLSMTTTQEANFSGYRDRKCQIEKDVKRTDRSLEYFAGEDNPNLTTLQGILMTYVKYNFDLGYVQGMSDLLAPILAIMENEVDAFWCFVGFMDMVFANFDIDQAGMKTQFNQLRTLLEFANPRLFKYMKSHDSDNMYFCFRWLLVWYKREFSNEDILKLWECLWTKLPCPNFHILISVAILDQETDIIIESKYQFTEILKHVNELSGNIDLQKTLKTAEAIYYQIKEAENLPNEIRQIIGEPLLETATDQRDEDNSSPQSFDDGFDELVRELTPEEMKRKQELLEEACERSMFLQYM